MLIIDQRLYSQCLFKHLSSSLVVGTEDNDLLFDAVCDSLCAGSEKLTRIEALALEILAGLDVLPGCFRESDLALSVDVNLGNAKLDGLLDHLGGDTGTAVKNERHVAYLLLDGFENVETKSCPVCGIFAVDVADAAGKEINAQICDQLALIGIRALALGNNAVFLAADAADFCLDGHAVLVSKLNQLFGPMEK